MMGELSDVVTSTVHKGLDRLSGASPGHCTRPGATSRRISELPLWVESRLSPLIEPITPDSRKRPVVALPVNGMGR